MRFLAWLKDLIGRRVTGLAIVRRYQDANGSYVGELYVDGRMVGMSLDTLPLRAGEIQTRLSWRLDLENGFLAPMPRGVVRVGSLEPRDNDSVRAMVSRMGRIDLTVQNRFVEHVMDRGE